MTKNVRRISGDGMPQRPVVKTPIGGKPGNWPDLDLNSRIGLARLAQAEAKCGPTRKVSPDNASSFGTMAKFQRAPERRGGAGMIARAKGIMAGKRDRNDDYA